MNYSNYNVDTIGVEFTDYDGPNYDIHVYSYDDISPSSSSSHSDLFLTNHDNDSANEASDLEEKITSSESVFMECLFMLVIKEVGFKEFLKRLLRKQLDEEYLDAFINVVYDKYHYLSAERQDKVYKSSIDITAGYTDEELPFERYEYINYSWTFELSLCKNAAEYSLLNHSFMSVANDLAKIIIFERDLPIYKKTIRPIDIGGKAGGVKYVSHGILFKFPMDVEIMPGKWLYGGKSKDHVLASQSVCNEIRCVQSLNEQKIKQNWECLQLPLMTTVTYLGTVLFACSLLPVEDDTLCYGTSDGGMTYKNEIENDENLHNLVQQIATTYHYEEHPVIDGHGAVYNSILASDVEIHRVKKMYYMLDFGRFNPPNNPNKPFLHLFRSEYLIDMHQNISCDAFSGFGRIDAEKYNRNASVIINQYIEHVKAFAFDISMKQFKRNHIKELLHKNGINLRHLGMIRYSLLNYEKTKKKSSNFVKSAHNFGTSSVERVLDMGKKKHASTEEFILMEIILRSCKSILQEKLSEISKNHVIPNFTYYQKAVFKFHVDSKDDSFWKSKRLKDKIVEKYGSSALYPKSNDDKELNVLKMLSNENQFILQELLPDYCYYKGGSFLFDVEIIPHCASSFPELDAEYIIHEIIRSTPRLSDSELLGYFQQLRSHISHKDMVVYVIYAYYTSNNPSFFKSYVTDWMKGLPQVEDEKKGLLNQIFHRNYIFRIQNLFEFTLPVLDAAGYTILDFLLSFRKLVVIINEHYTETSIRQLMDFPYLFGIEFRKISKINEGMFRNMGTLEFIEYIDFSSAKNIESSTLDFLKNYYSLRYIDLSPYQKSATLVSEITYGMGSVVDKDVKGLFDQIKKKGIRSLGGRGAKKSDKEKKYETAKILEREMKYEQNNYLTDLTFFMTLSNLEVLDLQRCSLQNVSLEMISNLVLLRHLNISSNPDISNAGMGHLQNMTKLEYLNITNCYQIENEAMATLSMITSLKYLFLGIFRYYIPINQRDMALTFEGLQHLVHLLNLEELYVGMSDLDDNEAIAIVSLLPVLRVFRTVECPNIINREWSSPINDIWQSSHHSKSIN